MIARPRTRLAELTGIASAGASAPQQRPAEWWPEPNDRRAGPFHPAANARFDVDPNADPSACDRTALVNLAFCLMRDLDGGGPVSLPPFVFSDRSPNTPWKEKTLDLQLNGARALVTGSSSGIGEGIARFLAAEGARLAVHGRDGARLAAVQQAISDAGGEAIAVTGDLATAEGCRQVLEAVNAEFGGVDILVNNAGGKASGHRQDGIERPANGPWLETPWDDWAWTYEQNVGAAVRLIQGFAPGMIAQGWGRIINISSASAVQPEPDLADYQPAKAAMNNMTAALAKSLAGTGVTVNTVSPGTIMTPAVASSFTEWAAMLGWDTGDFAEIERRFTHELIPQPVKHFGRPEDIARMVALLASPLSSYMTGANYRVDGGQCRSVN